MTYQDFTKLSERELDELCARAEGEVHVHTDEIGTAYFVVPGIDEPYMEGGYPPYVDSDGLTVHGLRLAKKAVEKDGWRFALSLACAVCVHSEGVAGFEEDEVPGWLFDPEMQRLATAFVSEPKAVLYAAINALVSTSGVREK